jgi:hypothetical protein
MKKLLAVSTAVLFGTTVMAYAAPKEPGPGASEFTPADAMKDQSHKTKRGASQFTPGHEQGTPGGASDLSPGHKIK